MARTLSSAVQGVLGDSPSHVVHLLQFQVGATSYYFAEDAVRHLAIDYKPHLVLEGPVTYSEQLKLQPVTVKLQNITLETAKVLKTEAADIQGVEATLQRLFMAVREAVTIFVGQISDVEVTEQEARLTLAGDLDPRAAQIPKRKYSPLHSSDGKTFEEMSATPHLFDGFLHISRDLTNAVEEQPPPEDDTGDWEDPNAEEP